MRIAFLADRAANSRRSLPSVLLDCRALAARGHAVTLVTDAPLPTPAAADEEQPDVELRSVAEICADTVPAADLVVATSAVTVEAAVAAGDRVVARYVVEPDGRPGRSVPLIVVARALADQIGATARAEVHVIPPAVDRATFFPAASEREPGETLRIGTLPAGMGAMKRVCRWLRDLGFDARLVPIDASSNQAVAETLRSVDALAVPGFPAGRGCGYVPELIEALACGTPCIVVDDPVIRESLGDRRDVAMCVEAGDHGAMAEAIAFVARHRGLRDRLRRAGFEATATLGHERHVDELERALALIAARAASSDAPPRIDASPLAAEVDLARTLANRAERHARDRRFDEATACLEAALPLAPTSMLILTRLGELRLSTGDFEGALDALDRAAAAGSTSCRLHEARATALRRLQRTEDAVRALDAAARCDDARPATFRALAEVLRAAGDVAGARVAVEEAAVRAAVS